MSQYLLLLHAVPLDFSKISPGEMQAVIQKYQAWSAQMRDDGRLLDGRKLKDDGGRLLRRQGGDLVVDGPFSEAKEAVGGFFLIEAAGYEEAVEVCQGCPHLEYGAIEIREIDLV